MDAATWGALLVGVGTVAGAVVAYLGKRGETALTGLSALTDNLQEERDRLDRRVTERDTRIAELCAQLAAERAEITRLRGIITRLGGDPS
jgi:chromosome segregation ATPase